MSQKKLLTGSNAASVSLVQGFPTIIVAEVKEATLNGKRPEDVEEILDVHSQTGADDLEDIPA